MEKLKKQALEEIQQARDLLSLMQVETKYFGRKKGLVTAKLKKLADLEIAERKKTGADWNRLKGQLFSALAEKKRQLTKQSLGAKEELLDVTEPGTIYPNGLLHPITQMTDKILEAFGLMGFEIAEGPEVDNDWYNFEALNFVLDHPARDMQDTFYINQQTTDRRSRGSDHLLLATHTTNVQARYLEKQRPPFKVVVARKCFRRDSDISHTPMFHQYDGFAVGERVSLTDLKGTIHETMKYILEDNNLQIRFRQSYFPFVEPGQEVDVTCTICGGKGCPTCKGTGWLEMLGCGMIHPNVLKNAGLNPNKWQGYAFGGGIERPFMIKHKVRDIRALFENDLRFLKQFS